jgi:FAD/FMN-containing dehydrogenase
MSGSAILLIKNPYYLGDEVGLTQMLGWVGAWTSRPSVYAVAAKSAAAVVAAVNFARMHNLRLVVKGGGHSFQGTSNAPDSLLIWTRLMNGVVLHDAFVGSGCEERIAPQPAVSIEAGAIWEHVYIEVMVKAGRYVQGGSALTVGVAGLVLGGGFGSLSKAFGLAAGNLLEAEVVTADGDIKLANACALAICGAGGPPAYPGVPGHEPDVEKARRDAATVPAAMSELRKLVPRAASYVWETDYFEPNWQDSFWGDNYARLRAIKEKYDPDGLFFLHHGEGSEDWSADGFTRVEAR